MGKLVRGLMGGSLVQGVTGGGGSGRKDRIKQIQGAQNQKTAVDLAAARSLQEAQAREADTEAASGRARKTPRGRRILINPEASKLG